jgi:hypothetical protein
MEIEWDAEYFMIGFRKICSDFDNTTKVSFDTTVKNSYEYWMFFDDPIKIYVNAHYKEEINKLCQPFIDFELRFS